MHKGVICFVSLKAPVGAAEGAGNMRNYYVAHMSPKSLSGRFGVFWCSFSIFFLKGCRRISSECPELHFRVYGPLGEISRAGSL